MSDLPPDVAHHENAAPLARRHDDLPGADADMARGVDLASRDDGDGRDYAIALIEAASLKHERKEDDGAERLVREGLGILERIVGHDDPALLPALSTLGSVLVSRGELGEAASALSRVIGIHDARYGPDHPDVAVPLMELVRVHLRRSDCLAAEPLLHRLLSLTRRKGEEHPEVATVLASLASVRGAVGDHEAAEHLCRRVVQIRERTLAPNHYATTLAIEHLADCCAARGRFDEALELCTRALGMRVRALGRGHPSVRSARERIADLQLQAADPATAALTETTVDVQPSPASDAATNIDPYLAELLALNSQLRADTERERPARTWWSLDEAITRLRARSSMPWVAASLVPLAVALAAYAPVRSTLSSDFRSDANALHAGPPAAEPLRATAPAPLVLLDDSSSMGAPRPVAAFDTNPVPTLPAVAAASTLSATAEPPVPAAPSLSTAVRRGIDSLTRSIAVAGKPSDIEPALPVELPTVRAALPTPSSEPNPRAPSEPQLIGEPPQPRYPPQLRNQRIEGEVVLQVMVDTTGRPDMSTLRIVRSTHELFSAAARDALGHARFEPARVAGAGSRAAVMPVRMAFRFQPAAR